MATRRRYLPTAVPTLGLVTSTPSSMLDSRATPGCNEVRFGVGQIEKMAGGVAFGDNVGGPVLGIERAFDKVLAFTEDDVLLYDNTTHTFSSIADVSYDGDSASFPSVAYYGGLYVIANGYVAPRKWDGSSPALVNLTGATNYVSKWVQIFGERLCLYNLVDTGTARTTRVRWSVVGNIETWTGSGSGFADISTHLASFDSIVRAEKLGSAVIIYGERSIAQQLYRADTDNPFSFGMRVDGKGLSAPRALVNIEGKGHIFLGWEDVYSYDGGQSVTGIGKEITDEMFQRINMETISTSFMVYVKNRKRIRLHVPLDGAMTPNYYFEYNLDEGSWTRGARATTGAGYGELSTPLTWNDLTVLGLTWDEMVSTWNELGGQAGRERLFYGTSAGDIYEDGLSKNIQGVAVDGYFDTKDYTSQERYENEVYAWMELNVEAKGDSLSVYYSTDGGDNYTLLSTQTLTGEWKRYRFDLEVYSRQIRFRFRNSSSNSTFYIRFFELGYLGGTVLGEEE